MADSRKTSDSSGLARKEATEDIRPIPTTASGPEYSEKDVTDEIGTAPVFVNGSRVLIEEENADKTAYAWSSRKKWILLTVVALCQTSMNFNAAIYSNAVEGINEHFGITNARMGMVAFLVTYVRNNPDLILNRNIC